MSQKIDDEGVSNTSTINNSKGPDSSNALPFVLPDNVEEEAKIVEIEFYKTTPLKLVFFCLSILITIGAAALLAKWKRSVYLFLKYMKTTPEQAQYLMIRSFDGTVDTAVIKMRSLCVNSFTRQYKTFIYRLYTFYLDKDGKFKPIQAVIEKKTYESIHREMGRGILSYDTYQQKLIYYGKNSTDIPAKPDLEILIDEILSPFYIFQLFAIIFWGFVNHYEIYAGFIFGVSLLTLGMDFFKIKSNHRKLRERAVYETDITVFRAAPSEQTLENDKDIADPSVVNSKTLVPGDLIEIPAGKKMPCDVILLSGTNLYILYIINLTYAGTCIMNESMLTGESIPIIKQQLPKTEKIFDANTADQYILYSGTECLETRRTNANTPVLGVVMRTGFGTMKGRLVRSFLYSKPENFKFYRDSLKYIGAMAVIAMICFAISVKSFVDQGEDAGYIVLKSLDIITIAVPPALPTVVAIGSALASARLEKQKIITKSELKINVAGKVKFMCFDKTGTLTKDSLDLHGVRALVKDDQKNTKFQRLVIENSHNHLNMIGQKTLSHKMLELMATCHSLTYIKGAVSGDPLDVRMFEAVGWNLIENDGSSNSEATLATLTPPASHESDGYYNSSHQVIVLKRFEFSAKLQRMSVIVKDHVEGKQRVYVKGSPEMISSLSRPETLPYDFNRVLLNYTESGLRVIACATRLLDEEVATRDDLPREPFEKDLEFLGFLIFENKMKEVTPSIIAKLKDANIQTIMLTGDNPLTAIFVARDCGIVEKNQNVILGTLTSLESDPNFKELEWRFIAPPKSEAAMTEETSSLKQLDAKGEVAIEMSKILLYNKKLKADDGRLDSNDLMHTLQDDNSIAIAMTGEAFNYFDSSVLTNLRLRQLVLKKSKVLARMRPDDKALIVDKLQKQGYIVGMCGDGANDCPALKVANVGISLSEAEASLAAPFMSKIINISCVDILLREGRTALVTSFQCFKYMSMYSLIQTFSTVILYTRVSAMTDPCFLYQDLFIIIPAAFTMSLTRPTKKLSKKEPTGSLLSIPVLSAMISQCIIQAVAQYIAIILLEAQEWYMSPAQLAELQEAGAAEAAEGEEGLVVTGEEDEEATVLDYDVAVLFLVGNIQYFATVMAFSIGKPFRKPFYKNYAFTLVVIITTTMSLVFLLVPIPALWETFEMKEIPQDFRWILLGLVVINSIITISFEKFIVPLIFSLGKKLFERKQQRKADRHMIAK